MCLVVVFLCDVVTSTGNWVHAAVITPVLWLWQLLCLQVWLDVWEADNHGRNSSHVLRGDCQVAHNEAVGHGSDSDWLLRLNHPRLSVTMSHVAVSIQRVRDKIVSVCVFVIYLHARKFWFFCVVVMLVIEVWRRDRVSVFHAYSTLRTWPVIRFISEIVFPFFSAYFCF